MTRPTKPLIAPRKKPKQARSTTLVDDVLEAAVRVLAREGAARFTTVRVAEEAGVSVGSLYQYFPNKEALLFRLQADEWEETWSVLDEILGDEATPPRDRLRRAVVTFFRSERAEASLRVALDDAGALIRDAPEAKALRAKTKRRALAFIGEALPGASQEAQAFAADFVFTTMSAVAERITSEGRTRANVDAWATATADALVAFLDAAGTQRRSSVV